MLTIKYKDADGFDRISEARDIRSKMSGSFSEWVAWINGQDEPCALNIQTTAYVMNDKGSTIAKYVVTGDSA